MALGKVVAFFQLWGPVSEDYLKISPIMSLVHAARASHFGGPSPRNPELLCSNTQLIDYVLLADEKPYQDPIVLHQKYVVKRSSLAQTAYQFLCPKGAIRDALELAKIPLRGLSDVGSPNRVPSSEFAVPIEKISIPFQRTTAGNL